MLLKKIAYKSQYNFLIYNAPDFFHNLIQQEISTSNYTTNPADSPMFDVVMGFALTLKEVGQLAELIQQKTTGDSVVWIAYAKGSSKKYKCEFNRDNGWSEMKAIGFETVTQIAIDEDWSALRFRRLEFIKTLTRKKL
jgi:hypothetical protein